jgi:hypothetical protein
MTYMRGPNKEVCDSIAQHNIHFSSSSIIDKATGYMDHLIKVAIMIRLHP